MILSKANKALVVPATPEVAGMFADAPRVTVHGNEHLVIPHGLRETLMLRHLNFPAPSPLIHYDWPHPNPKEPPFDTQKTTCDCMALQPRFYNLNDKGTGKSRTVLWTWDFLFSNGYCGALLVVAPRSTLYFNWMREVMSVLPHRRVQVLYGSKDERLRKLATPADIYIINHHGIDIIRPELEARKDIDVLALDELAVYRNNSGRSKVMRKFVKRFKWAWGLTGDPMPKEPTDVWGQCMILTPHTVPSYRNACRDVLMIHKGGYRYEPKPDAIQRAFSMMQPSIRFTLDEVTELPDLIMRTADVDLSDEQRNAYKQIATLLAARIKNKDVRVPNAGAMLGKLLQCAGGWIYAPYPDIVRVDPTPRIKALYDIIMSSNRKVLVAVPYRHMIEGLSKILHHKDVKLDHCVVHGDTRRRDEIFSDFQSTSKYKAMLVHPETAHHGLTLTAAATIIWYLPVTSLEVYSQFNARIRRVGQTHKQEIIHLQSTPVERKVYRMLQNKQDIQQSFLRLVEEASEISWM